MSCFACRLQVPFRSLSLRCLCTFSFCLIALTHIFLSPPVCKHVSAGAPKYLSTPSACSETQGRREGEIQIEKKKEDRRQKGRGIYLDRENERERGQQRDKGNTKCKLRLCYSKRKRGVILLYHIEGKVRTTKDSNSCLNHVFYIRWLLISRCACMM